MRNSRTRARLLLPGVALGALAVAGVLLCGELVARLGGGVRVSGIAHDSRLGWRYFPREAALLPGGARERFNSWGFRGAEWGRRPGGRWIAVGDSFTAGMDVEEARTFVSRLRSRTGIELLNAGVSAWATDQQLLFIEEEAIAHHRPDGVLLVFSPNDVRETWAKRFVAPGADGALERPGAPALSARARLAWALSNRSALFQWMQGGWEGSFSAIFRYFPVSFELTQLRRPARDPDLYARQAEPEIEEARAFSERLLGEIARVCRKAGVRLALTTIPMKLERDGSLDPRIHDPRLIRDQVKRFAETERLGWADLHEPLGRLSIGQLFVSGGTHFGETGHRAIADALAEPLLSWARVQ